jgi:hypothetical protein
LAGVRSERICFRFVIKLYYVLKTNRALWLFSCLLSILIFSITSAALGMYLDDNEAIVAAINYGVLGEVSNEQYWSDYHTFLLPLLYKLSSALPYIPVFGLWKMSFVVLINVLVIRIGLGELKGLDKHSRIVGFVILPLVCLIIVADNQLHLHCIRHSVMLSFLAFLLNYQKIREQGKTSITAIFIFFIAANTRSHSSALMLGCFTVFLFFSGTPILRIVRHYSAMLLIVLGFLGAYQIYGKYTPNMGKYIEAHYEYALIEKQSLFPLSHMKTARDSAKYLAISNFFITDSAELTIPFFDRVANIKYEQEEIFTQQRFLAAIEELKVKNRSVFPLLVLMFLPLLGWTNKNVRRAGTAKTITLIIVSSIVIFSLLLILVDDMKLRFYSPFVSVIAFSIIIFHLSAFLKYSGPWRKYISIILLLTITIWQFWNLRNEASFLAAKECQTQKQISHFHAFTSKHPVLMFMGSDIPFSTNPFYRSSTALYPKLASFDGGYLIYFSYARGRFEKLFGVSPIDFPAVINMLRSRDDIVFYIAKERLDIINQYFQVVYKVKFNVSPIIPKPPLDLNAGVFFVSVEEI